MNFKITPRFSLSQKNSKKNSPTKTRLVVSPVVRKKNPHVYLYEKLGTLCLNFITIYWNRCLPLSRHNVYSRLPCQNLNFIKVKKWKFSSIILCKIISIALKEMLKREKNIANDMMMMMKFSIYLNLNFPRWIMIFNHFEAYM